MRHVWSGRRRALGLAPLALALAACGGSSSGGASHPTASTGQGFSLAGMGGATEGATGVAFLRQSGDHVTGWRVVWGLKPGSRHANHLHGPDGACAPASKQTMNMAVVLPDLVANADGVAYGKIDLTVHQKVVGPGYYVMVHRDPTPASERNQIGSAPASAAFMKSMGNNPPIACGDVPG